MAYQPTPCSLTLAALLWTAGMGIALADSPRKTVTLYNRSGQPVLVKLVGTTSHVVEVPDGAQRTVPVVAEEYALLARYGADPRRYTYARGERFAVDQGSDWYSPISITLHAVIDGNYATHPATAEEFGRALPNRLFPDVK
jgi:hypothetical protein